MTNYKYAASEFQVYAVATGIRPKLCRLRFVTSTSLGVLAALLGPCLSNIAGSQYVYNVRCRTVGCPPTMMFLKRHYIILSWGMLLHMGQCPMRTFIIQLQLTQCMFGDLEESCAINPLNSLITVLCGSSDCHGAFTQFSLCSQVWCCTTESNRTSNSK